jgi:hypothetical protein
MGEQMFMMKTEAVSWPTVVSHDLVQSVEENFVKDSASQFQNFQVNFHKFHATNSESELRRISVLSTTPQETVYKRTRDVSRVLTKRQSNR